MLVQQPVDESSDRLCVTAHTVALVRRDLPKGLRARAAVVVS